MKKNLSKNINTWERAGTYIHTYMYTETYRRLWSSTQAGKLGEERYDHV